MRRLFSRLHAAALLCVLALGAGSAHAQEVPPVVGEVRMVLTAPPVSFLPGGADRLGRELVAPVRIVNPEGRSSRGTAAVLWSLYAATAVTQMMDVHSTRRALAAGAFEANPMMRGLAARPAAFIAVKGGMSLGMILAARQTAPRHRVAAIATLVAVNTAYALIARHNYALADAARR